MPQSRFSEGDDVSMLLAIDQGTTSSRCIAFDTRGTVVALAQREFAQHFPRDGWVEHDPEDIWRTTCETLQSVVSSEAVARAGVACVGITNQRETTLVWDRETGIPIHRAIVWQDRRTADVCAQLREAGFAALVAERTGLLLDPYFSATKIAWILDHVDGARARAQAGRLAFGTVDTFLLWRLCNGARHCTDATNAARTLLFDIHRQCWDDDLLAAFRVPRALLPEVLDSSADFGVASPHSPCPGVRIGGMAGDQQAALIGQGCLAPGQAKSTYGTGCFLMLNTGATAVASRNRLLTTVAYRTNGKPCFALEGSIFIAGAAVKWLRDGLHVIRTAAETEDIARRTGDAGGVYVVPAFTGLGAPYWDPHARGAIFGLTRDSGVEAIVTATLQAIAYQTRDLLDAMARDGCHPALLRVDGGVAVNDWLMQFLADQLGMAVCRPAITESTALGAASLAGLHVGLLSSLDQLSAVGGEERRFLPTMAEAQRQRLYAGWQDAVQRVTRNTPVV
jgi:glycerol kinase